MKKVIFCLMASAGLLSAQNDIIVDNPQAVFDGKWDVAKSAKDRYGDDYRSTFCVAGVETATATYRPEIVVAGKYNVEVMYPRGDNRSTNAAFTISAKNGTQKVHISQRENGGKWVRLAAGVDFDSGSAGFVRLSNNTGEDQETAVGKPVVIADAIRFVLTSKSSGATETTSSSPHSSHPTTHAASTPGWRWAVSTTMLGSGKVTISPDQPGFGEGETVELRPQAAAGQVFAGWSGDVSGFDIPLRLRMTNSFSVTAEFLPEALGAIVESTEATVEGTWSTNSQVWTGQRTDSYLFSQANAMPTRSVTFRPNLPKAGKYDVYAYYLNGDNRAEKTNWEIGGKRGTTLIDVDQRKNGRMWCLLASGVEFDAGTHAYVRVTNKAEPIPSVVIADSVAFVYVGSTSALQ